MVQEETVVEPPEEVPEAAPEAHGESKSIHIWMPAEVYEQIKKWARYAVLEGLIEGHPRGNITDYTNFCFNLGEQYLKQYMLKKRGYK